MQIELSIKELELIQVALEKSIKDWNTFCTKDHLENLLNCQDLLTLQIKIIEAQKTEE